jgi:hypothetical protein
MIEYIFEIVARGLQGIANMANISYYQANIIVYFVVIPLIWSYMIDRAYRFHYVKLVYIAMFLFMFFLVDDHGGFCDLLFYGCVLFLRLFEPWGVDYYTSSVIFCVILPVIFHIWLVRFTQKKRQRKETSQEET